MYFYGEGKRSNYNMYHYVENKGELVHDAKVQEPLCNDESLQNYHDNGYEYEETTRGIRKVGCRLPLCVWY